MNLDLELLFFGFHSRVVLGSRAAPMAHLRKGIELLLFGASVVSLALLAHLHLSFVGKPGCLPVLLERQNLTKSDFQVLAVEIHGWKSALIQGLHGEIEDVLRELNQTQHDLLAEVGNRSLADAELSEEEQEENDLNFSVLEMKMSFLEGLKQAFDSRIRFQITEHHGFLRLPPAVQQRHNVTVLPFVLHANDSCLGGPLTRFLLEYIVGYDTAIFNSAVFVYEGKGYFHTMQTRETFYIPASLKLGSSHPVVQIGYMESFFRKFAAVSNSFFIFFVTTGAVSVIFQGTQLRMLRMYVQVVRMLHMGRPVAAFLMDNILKTFVNLMLLMATMLFTSEFVEDSMIGFFLVFLGWCAELFMVCCARTSTTLLYWPRFFRMVQISFLVYHMAVPFGFSWLALVADILLTQFLMFHFFNHYEVPAFEAEEISPLTPRAIAYFSTANSPMRQAGANPTQGQVGVPRAAVPARAPVPPPHHQLPAQVPGRGGPALAPEGGGANGASRLTAAPSPPPSVAQEASGHPSDPEGGRVPPHPQDPSPPQGDETSEHPST